MDIELATDPYACMMYIVSPLAGLGGGILWRPRVYSLFFLKSACYSVVYAGFTIGPSMNIRGLMVGDFHRPYVPFMSTSQQCQTT